MKAWIYRGEISSHSPERFYEWLSVSERERAGLYLTEEARDRFLVRRGVLRALLGVLLQKSPGQIVIRQTPFGKPETEGLEFSLSSRENKMLFAFSFDGPIGVDIEKVDFSLAKEGMEELLFGPEERCSASRLSTQQRGEYLLQVWAKKEAWLKAIGCGLSGDLKAYDTESSCSGWKFTPVPADTGYTAFLATREEVSACQHLQV